MAEISKIQLPGGGIYDLKDETARQMISGGVSFIIAWDGASTPVISGIPAGVKVTYNGTTYTGTLSAESAEAGAFYLVRSSTEVETLDVYDEYVPVGSATKTWEKIGDTQVDLSNVVTNVTLNKQTDVALGEATTFTNSSSSVSFSGSTSDSVLGADTTFNVTNPTISVSPTTRYLSASATGGAVSASGDNVTVVTGYSNPNTDTFVKSVTAETGKNLVTTTVPNVTGNSTVTIPNVTGNSSVTIPNVTNVGTASTWSFTMGSGADAETLIIGGANSTTPTLGTDLTATNTTLGTALSASRVTLGTAITVATGATSTTGTGDAVVTGVTVGDTGSAITGLGTASTDTVLGTASTFSVTNPSISLTANTSSGTGRVQYMQSATASASGGAVSANTNDIVDTVTNIGTGTAAAQNITVGTNDKITTLTNSTSITVTKGN